MLELGRSVDRYSIEGVLGKGGMATVYLVRHTHLGSQHAMKVIDLPSPAIRERLIEEGRAQSALRHTNIASVTDLIVVDGSPALIMEFVEGPSLDAVLAQGPLGFEQADFMARSVIAGMIAAHKLGLIHRDLKPSNIMLALSEGGLVPKIIDFGLVKDTERGFHERTRTGMTMGTPAYMAPEQVRDAKHIDQRVDIFALGAILYELVTGQRAFVGSDTFEIFRSIADGSYIPPHELVPQLPPHIASTIQKALQTDPDDRFASCEELLTSWVGENTTLVPEASSVWDTEKLRRLQAVNQLKSAQELIQQRSQETFVSFASEGSISGSMEPLETAWPHDLNTSVAGDTAGQSGEQAQGRSGWLLSAVAGFFLSFPFILGALTLIFGTLSQAFANTGPFIVLVTLLCAATFSVTMVLQKHKGHWLGAWLLMPVAVILAGSVGTTFGISMARSSTLQLMTSGDSSNLSWVSQVPRMASGGIQNALSLAAASFSLTGFACLVIALVIASRAPGSWSELTFSPRIRLITLLTVGFGGVFWLISPMIRDYPSTGPGGVFLVFLSLCLFGLASARVADGDSNNEHLWHARWGVFLVGFMGITICLETESIFASMELFRVVGMDGTPIERVANAKMFCDAVDGITGLNMLIWSGVALTVAMVPLLRQGGVRMPFPKTRLVLPAMLVLIRFVAPAVALSQWVLCAKLVVHGQEAAAVHELLGFVSDEVPGRSVLDFEGSGQLVVKHVNEGVLLKPGDVVIAVNGRQVVSVGELVTQLDQCWCDPQSGGLRTGAVCELSAVAEVSCLSEEGSVNLTVSRKDDAGVPRLSDVSVPVGGH